MMHSSSNRFFVLPFFKGHEISESALTVFLVSVSQPQYPFNCVEASKGCYLDSVLNLKEAGSVVFLDFSTDTHLANAKLLANRSSGITPYIKKC